MPADDGLPITSAAISLAVILVLLALAAWAAARLRRGGFSLGQGRATPIAIIATRIVGPQASLMIVEAEGLRFLVGAGRAGITAITPLGPAPAGADAPFETVLARATPAGEPT